jgi:hypothetical protein
MSRRIQRQRTKGWRMPEGAVYVGRPSRWGNPWREGAPHPDHGRPMTRTETIDVYRGWVAQSFADWWGGLVLRTAIDNDLRGHDLACWCPLDAPCHADVLLELAS